ncbi:2'-5' RNA ligase family protein [Gordonia sp. PDNC005]|uniref:2'-5' RNA ligase family protein n=1 Tax=unclassified Gordonia (in: high G+C Gram-positive bacteria) TaxID=2657482 RepID=UPI0019658C1F|nr:2'-5' RNA ligase family protein [Gordonia sp. PDNC005]QRY64436.1 2'-5' RNA ligase family protein [Gordonia sp. PDNC005]
MAVSIELLLDDAADAVIRDRWRSLAAFGVNPAIGRPHCTLIAGAAIRGADTRLATVAQRLPIPVLIGPPVALPAAHGLFTLAASVVPSSELLSIHATVHRLCGDGVDGLVDHVAPGSWTPHITLARRLTADRVGSALTLDCSPIRAHANTIRRWDGNTGSETVVTGRAC